jgi:hypothetical protein
METPDVVRGNSLSGAQTEYFVRCLEGDGSCSEILYVNCWQNVESPRWNLFMRDK